MNRFATAQVLLFTMLLGVGAERRLAAAPADRPPAVAPAEEPRGGDAGFQFQELDDPVRRLRPVKAREASDEARLDALAWFAAGRLMQDRGDSPGALRAYRKAIERDPTALPVFR